MNYTGVVKIFNVFERSLLYSQMLHLFKQIFIIIIDLLYSSFY